MAVNEMWAGMLGYRLAELEPLSLATFDHLVHPDDRAASERISARRPAPRRSPSRRRKGIALEGACPRR